MNTQRRCVVVLLKNSRREGGSYVGILYLWFVPDDWKWEIKPLGAGYTIQRVSMPSPFAAISATIC